MHDIAQKCYDDMAASIAMFMGDVQTRQEALLKELHELKQQSDVAMAKRLRDWRGEPSPEANKDVDQITGKKEDQKPVDQEPDKVVKPWRDSFSSQDEEQK